MKKILTVSLFAMMAVSAANADIASTDYVGKQITATAGTLNDLQTTAKANLVGAINELKDDMTTMDSGYGTEIDELTSSFTAYQTTNDAAVKAAKKAGDDAQADLNAYKETNASALALKANAADVYTKTAADAEFMNSSEVSTAIANAVTGKDGALKDYVTNTAFTQSQTTQDTTLKKYADDAAAAAKSGAESTASAALDAYKETNAAAVADAKKAGTDATAALNAYKETNASALALKANAADVYTKTAADAEFMNSSEVSTAIANAVTGANGALKDYSTTEEMNQAITDKAVNTVVSGSVNGTIAVDGKDVAVKGLGSAAYTASSTYATSAQGTKADNAVARTQIGAAANFAITDECKATGAVCSLVVRAGVAGWEKITY